MQLDRKPRQALTENYGVFPGCIFQYRTEFSGAARKAAFKLSGVRVLVLRSMLVAFKISLPQKDQHDRITAAVTWWSIAPGFPAIDGRQPLYSEEETCDPRDDPAAKNTHRIN